jgi:eukaryotic-like serine/threonine-protein kinase
VIRWSRLDRHREPLPTDPKTVVTSQRSQSSEQGSGLGSENPVGVRSKAAERLGESIRGKYQLEALLGVGGMASVYAARHRNGSRVAIKIMHAEFAREEGVKKRFLREGYVANKVDHPGVVKIVDDDETELGEPFLVMELLEGETLQQLWKRRKRKVPPGEALAIAAQVLDVLVPFHEQNIVHRDLKPANIFICNDDAVKLLDFGVAQLREGGEAMTRAGTALGTPSFMSPEQAMGKSEQLDGRSDIFSVGATLFAILSGKRLHHGRSDNEAFILAATQPAPSVARTAPDLDVEIIALVDRALQWDRRKRFRSAGEMRDACVELLYKVGGPIPTSLSSRPPPGHPSERPSQPTIGASPAGLRRTPSPGASSPHTPSTARPLPPGGARRPLPPPPARSTPAAMGPSPPVAAPDRHREPQPKLSDDLAGEELVLEDAEESHERLHEVFQRLERALPALRQYGFDHPEGRQRLKIIHRIFVEALHEKPEGLSLQVHPFCLTHRGTPVWEPSAPLDLVPYNLTLAAIDGFVLKRDLDEEELSTFLAAIMLDPSRDEDSDIAGALWEASFRSIEFSLRQELADADAHEERRFFADTADLEKMAREDLAEAAAMAVAADRGALSFANETTSALALDPTAQSALGLRLSADDQRWHDRHLDLIIPALVDAAKREDVELMLEPMRQHGYRLAQSGAFEELVELHDALLDRVTMHLDAPRWGVTPRLITEALFPGPVLEVLIDGAREPGTEDHDRAMILGGLRGALSYLGAQHAMALLKLADALDGGDLQDVLLDYVEIHLASHRTEVVALLDTLTPALAQRMLAALTASGSDRSVCLLKPLLMSENASLRCEATALLARDPDELGKQLARLLESNDTRLRAAALTTMVRHQVRSAGPSLVRVIEAEGFADRALAEQRQMFETLYALSDTRAESLLVAIVDQHGMLADERLDRTRALAAEVLGNRAHSTLPLEALENATRRRPWNTQELRVAAGEAAACIASRLHHQAAAEVER